MITPEHNRNIEKLKKLFPNAFTAAGQIDLATLAQEIGVEHIAPSKHQDSSKTQQSSELNPGMYKLSDILDREILQAMIEDFNKMLGISIGIIDNYGEILISTGWQDVCTKFHRVNPQTCQNCYESDNYLTSGIDQGEFKLYKCKNNMWDMATPIRVEGNTLGNIIIGQFFIADEKIDEEIFIAQAKKFNFDQVEYLAALHHAPRFTRQTIEATMAFFGKLGNMISKMAVNNVKLARTLHEKEQLYNHLKEREDTFRILTENASDVIWTIGLDGKHQYVSPSAFKLSGYTPEEFMDCSYLFMVAPNSIRTARLLFSRFVSKIKEGIIPKPQTIEIELLKKDNTTIWTEMSIDIILDGNGHFQHFLGVTRNIDQRKKAEEKLKASEERLNSLINATPDFICLKDNEGRWQVTNQTGIELFNLGKIPYQGKTDMEITALSPESYKDTHIGCIESDKKAWEQGAIYHVEETIHKFDGTDVILDVIKVPLYHENGARKGLVIVGRDITEKKKTEDQIEESREKYKFLSNASFESIFVSENGILLEQNKTAELTFGYTSEEAIGMAGINLFIPEDRERVNDNRSSGTEIPYEATALRKDGTTFPCMLRGRTMKYKGRKVRITSLTDITVQKNAEKALRQSEERYRLIFENAPLGILTYNDAGEITADNEEFAAIMGTSRERLIQLNMLQLPDHRVVDSVTKSLKGDLTRFEGEYTSVTANKTTYVKAMFAPLYVNNCVAGGVAIVEDITAEKQAEEKMKASEIKYKTLFQTSPSGILVLDEEGKIRELNQEILKTTQYSAQELIGECITKLAPTTDISIIHKHIHQILDGEILEDEVINFRKDGTPCYFHIKETAITLPDGKRGILSVSNDITARKQAEQKLIESRMLLQTIIDTEPECIKILNREGEIMMMNAGGLEMLEAESLQQVQQTPLSTFIPAEHMDAFFDMHQRVLAGNRAQLTFEMTGLKGGRRWLESNATPMMMNGEIVHLAVTRDITSQKKAQDALIESEKRLKNIIDVSPVPMALNDEHHNITFVNSAFTETFGYTLADIPVLSVWWQKAYPDPDYRQEVIDNWGNELRRANETVTRFNPMEVNIRCKNGETKVVVASASSLQKSFEQTHLVVLYDITLLKDIEHRLRESEQKYRLIAENTSDAIVALNAEEEIVYASPSYSKITGYSLEESLHHTNQELYSFVHEDDRKITYETIHEAVKNKKEELTFSYRIKHKKGHYIWREDNAKFNYDAAGNCTGAYIICRDITDRKLADEKLKSAYNYARSLIEASLDPLVTISVEGKITDVNYATELATGLCRKTLIGTNFSSYFTDPNHADLAYQETFDRGFVRDFPLTMKHTSGKTTEVLYNANLYKDENNNTIGVFAAARDISERLQIERQYQQLFNEMQDGFALHEIICDEHNRPIDYRFLAVNPSFEIQTGLKADDIVGKTILEILPSVEKWWIEIYGEVALSGHPTTFENYSKALGKYYQITAFSHTAGQFAALYSDITSRKEAESIIKEHHSKLEELVQKRTNELMIRETYLSSIIDNHPGMFWMKDIDGRFIFSNKANDKFQRLLHGEKADTILGKTDFDFCTPRQAKDYLREDKKVIEARKEIESEDRITIDNKELWFQKLKFPVINSENETIGVAGYSIDITDRIAHENQLRMQSEAFESFALSIIITDANGIIEWCNTAFEKLTGYTMKEVVGRKTNLLKSGNQSEEFYRKLWRTVHAGLVWSGEFINQRKDGSTYYEESTITPVRDRDGIISHFIAIKINITERKEMEEALRLSEQRWQFAIEGSGDGIFDCNLITKKQYYSPLWKSILGYENREIGDSMNEWIKRIHPDDIDRYLRDTNNYIDGITTSYSNEHRLRCKNRSYKWVMIRGIAIHRDETGRATRIIGTMSDITEVKKLEDSLRKNIEKERELNEMKSRFVANASHEFRTPLASILITNDSLLHYWERYSSEQIHDKLEKIKSNTELLNGIVDDMLQLSKIEEGKLTIHPAPVDIVALCRQTVEEFKEEQLMSRIELNSDFDDLMLNIDSRLIKQSINNLMSNALKYSDQSSKIIVQLSQENGFFKFCVSDFGIGIPEADQKHLFTPYFRASNTRMIKGNGLGLNIIKGIVEMHGGNITFVSKPNKGSSFTIHLPIANETK